MIRRGGRGGDRQEEGLHERERERTLMGVSALVLIKKSALFLIANINERTIFMAIQLLSI